MKSDFDVIKKAYGERFAKLCRTLFPTILETENLLSKTLLENFAPNQFLYDDIVSNSAINTFKKYVYEKSGVKDEILEYSNLTPEELMDKAGYVLYKCETYEDTLKLGPNYYTFLTKCMFDYKLDENNRIERFIVRVNGEQYYFDV